MKTQKLEVVAKPEFTKIDEYTRIVMLRLFKNDDNSVATFKKYIFLGSVVSYEEGDSSIFKWDGPIIYVITEFEAFYAVGDVKEFDKRLNEYINTVCNNNPSEGT